MAELINDLYSFVDKFKLYFSTISLRSIHYAFFNLDDDVAVLCNASTSTRAEFGDRLTEFNVSDLSFHVLQFTDTEFFNDVRAFFKIPSSDIYALNVTAICTILNKAPVHEVLFNLSDNHDLNITCGQETSCVGTVVVNNHVRDELCYWYNYIKQIGTQSHRDTHPNILSEYTPPKKLRNFRLAVNLSEFKEMEDCQSEVNFIIHDGLSLPNIKVFLKDKPITMYLWIEDDTCVFIMFIYNDDVVSVRSVRPCVRTIPLPKRIRFDTKNTTDLTYKDK